MGSIGSESRRDLADGEAGEDGEGRINAGSRRISLTFVLGRLTAGAGCSRVLCASGGLSERWIFDIGCRRDQSCYIEGRGFGALGWSDRVTGYV